MAEGNQERYATPGPAQPVPTPPAQAPPSGPIGGDPDSAAPDLGKLNQDYTIPGVEPGDTDPYRWHTGEKRDHGGGKREVARP